MVGANLSTISIVHYLSYNRTSVHTLEHALPGGSTCTHETSLLYYYRTCSANLSPSLVTLSVVWILSGCTSVVGHNEAWSGVACTCAHLLFNYLAGLANLCVGYLNIAIVSNQELEEFKI